MLPVDTASGDNPRADKTRRLMLARAPIFALAIKFSHDLEKITGGEGFSTCYANGDVELQRFNPMKVQEAGSSIPFAHENEYPKYPGNTSEEHLAPSTMFLDIDKMIGKYKQEWIATPESEVLPSLSRPKTSHLTTYDQNALENEWIGWGNQMFRNVILTVFPEFALTCIDSDVPTIPSVLKGLLPMSTTGVTGILAAIAAGWGPPTYLEEPTIKANAQALVFYDLCFASRGKTKKGSYITADEFGAQLDTLRSTDSGPRKGSTPKIHFHWLEGGPWYDTCIFATRLHDLADLRTLGWSTFGSSWFFAILKSPARSFADFGLVDLRKLVVFCDFQFARATLCGVWAGRPSKTRGDFQIARATLCGVWAGRPSKTRGFLQFPNRPRDPLRSFAWLNRSRCGAARIFLRP